MTAPATSASLAEALITLQASLPRIRKDDEAQVGTRVYSYANLSTITDAVLPRLAELGLYWVTLPTMDADRFVLRYRLEHSPSGEFVTGDYPLPSGNPQTMGGAITYARRYALCAVLGLAPAEDDDDANAAADEARDRQRMRTRAIADERAHTPPPHPRPAERLRGPLPDDEWTMQTDENTPGTSTGQQHQKIGILFGKLGITDRKDRLVAVMTMLGLDSEPGSSKELSYRQAAELIGKLEQEASKP